MTTKRKITAKDQRDFWPELATKAMVTQAMLTGARAPARRHEDGRASTGTATHIQRLGNPALNPDSFSGLASPRGKRA